MERAWAVASILCVGAAGILLLRGQSDAAFVVAALGAVAWFLSYRVKLRRTILEPVAEGDEETDESEDDDEPETRNDI